VSQLLAPTFLGTDDDDKVLHFILQQMTVFDKEMFCLNKYIASYNLFPKGYAPGISEFLWDIVKIVNRFVMRHYVDAAGGNVVAVWSNCSLYQGAFNSLITFYGTDGKRRSAIFV
jgi:hypothetical protein